MKRVIPWFEALDYRHASARGRRLIELRVTVAIAVQRLRRARGLTQAQLGALLQSNGSRISKLERAAGTVTLDFACAALVALEASDAQLAQAFNAEGSVLVKRMRERASLRFYPKPGPDAPRDYRQ
jgi:transcriptional regulator with XRE-family HTH domain